MSARHLATVDDILCGTEHHWPVLRVAALDDVTCLRCEKALARVRTTEDAAAWRRGYDRDSLAACEAVGVAHLWSRIDASSASGRLLRDVLSSFARGFAEIDTESA